MQIKKQPSAALVVVLLAVFSYLTIGKSLAQGAFRQLLQQRMQQSGQETDNDQPESPAEETPRSRFRVRGNNTDVATETLQIANLKCAVWRPKTKRSPAPLVIFSHGFHGSNTQSKFLMRALADDGFLVVAPNHHDAGFAEMKPQVSFGQPSDWSEKTYKDRCDDITNLIDALHKDPKWNSQIDWSRVALAGHSLGGYTAMALGGAWPSWKVPDVKAVLALSPWCEPFIVHGTLAKLNVPIMYEGGTRDRGITPSLKRSGGAYDATSSPEYFVEFDNCGHFSFSDLNPDPKLRNLITDYSLAFLDKYVKGDASAQTKLGQKLPGVVILQSK